MEVKHHEKDPTYDPQLAALAAPSPTDIDAPQNIPHGKFKASAKAACANEGEPAVAPGSVEDTQQALPAKARLPHVTLMDGGDRVIVFVFDSMYSLTHGHNDDVFICCPTQSGLGRLQGQTGCAQTPDRAVSGECVD